MSAARRLVAIVLNYRTPQLSLRCAHSLAPQLDPSRDRLVIVDNASGDGSAEEIEAALAEPALADRSQLIRSPNNGGFAAGNNLGIGAGQADYYLLANSDSEARPGLVETLLHAAEAHGDAGLIGPRIDDTAGRTQVSAFRYPTPISEFASAADNRWIDRCFERRLVPLAPSREPTHPEWLSFASVLIRGAVVRQIGPLDEGFFLYFEDVDYCRRASEQGWRLLRWPEARAIHDEGGSSGLPGARKRRERLPHYYYEARARYFRKYYGAGGLWLANTLRCIGLPIAHLRACLGGRPVGHARGEAMALWRASSSRGTR